MAACRKMQKEFQSINWPFDNINFIIGPASSYPLCDSDYPLRDSGYTFPNSSYPLRDSSFHLFPRESSRGLIIWSNKRAIFEFDLGR